MLDRSPQPILPEQIELMLRITANAVATVGPQYAPMLEHMEQELEKARKLNPVERAKRILDRYAHEPNSSEQQSTKQSL
jgi:hypothetical protein